MNRMIIICAAAASLAGAALVSTEASAKGGKGFKHGGGYALKHHGGHWGHGGHGGWGHGNWGHGHYRLRHRRHVGFSDYGCWRRYWTPYGMVRRNVCINYY